MSTDRLRQSRASAARVALERLIMESDARPAEQRAMISALDALWLAMVDDAPVYPSPLGAWRRKDPP